MKTLSLPSSGFLVEHPVPRSNSKVPVPDHVNHLWIYDRSGSMYSTLPGLIKDLIEKSKSLAVGDTVTVGWFSSQGQFNWILKGFQIVGDKSYKQLADALNANSSTIGMTCFSEILTDVDQVLTDLKVLGDWFSVMFFSDGYPVVSNYEREVTAIFSAIKQVQGKIQSALMVGYGQYYNKELMQKMADSFGGSLIHSGDLQTFSTALDDFIKDAVELAPKVEIQLPAGVEFAFSFSGRNISVLIPNESNVVSVAPQRKGSSSVFYMSSDYSGDLTTIPTDVTTLKKTPSLIRAVWGLALVLTQRTKVDKAMEVLDLLGDVHLVDAVNNAFTNEEYGKAEAAIRKAAFVPKARFLKGRQPGYLPNPKAFCVLDAIDLLMNDEEAKFYPQKMGEYNRISRKTEAKDKNGPVFTPKKDVAVDFREIVWNDTKLNLSIQCKIEGTVKLEEGCEALGLSQVYPTNIWRNFSIVKDGFVNIPSLPISCSNYVRETLEYHGLISSSEGNVHFVDLTTIPTVNRSIVQDNPSAEGIASQAWREFTLEGRIKSWKALLGELKTDTPTFSRTVFTDGQEQFLAKHYIGHHGFSPPTAATASTDQYNAKEFIISLKGCSSLPKVSLVRESMINAKQGITLKVSMRGMAEALTEYDNSKLSGKTAIAWVEEKLEKDKAELKELRKLIQRTKFAVLLGKKWFREFTSREDSVLPAKDERPEIKFTVREVVVEI